VKKVNKLALRNKNNMHRSAGFMAMIISVLFLSACAGTPAVPETADEVVKQRAEARWAALLAKDPETAYSYYSPGYRSTTSVVDFMFKQRDRKVKWTSAEYKEHSCTETRCSITFNTGFRVNKAIPGMDTYDGKSVTEETWVKTENQWWYVPKKG
jgi:hypothetical protein